MYLKFLVLCTLSFVLAGCAVNPKPPAKKSPTSLPTTTTSSLIELPVSIQYGFLEDTINQTVPTILLSKTGQVFECPKPIKLCTWQLIVKRNGRITVTPTAAGALLIRVPVVTESGRVDAEFFAPAENDSGRESNDGPEPQASTHADVYANLVVAPTVEVSLNANWSIKPKILLDIDVQAADVSLKGIRVSVRGMLRKAINDEKSNIEDAIASAVGKINLRPPVEQAWKSL